MTVSLLICSAQKCGVKMLRMTTTMSTRSVLVGIIVACASLIRPAHGFAAWLAEGAKCWTDLDPSEVIMNNAVVPYSESSYQNIAIHVYAADDASRMVEPTKITSGDGNQQIMYVQDGPQAEYILKLHIPPDDLKGGALGDLQYVMDLSLSSPATFSGGNRGCDNRRAHGRRTDTVQVRIDFDGPAADETDAGDDVKVWAGWATGHEAVVLTDAVVFIQKKDLPSVDAAVQMPGEGPVGAVALDDEAAGAANKDTVEVPEDSGRIAAADYEGGGKSKSLSDGERKANAKERLDEMRRNGVHHVDGGHDHGRIVQEQMGQRNAKKRKNNGGDDDDDGGDESSNKNKEKRKYDKPKSRDSPKTQIEKSKKKKYIPTGPRPIDGEESSFGAFRRRYHKHELGLQQFNMGGYITGCILLSALGFVLANYSKLVERRLHKGSRTL